MLPRSSPALLAASIVVGVSALVRPAPLRAQDDRVGATECCVPLLFPIGARAVGLGNSLTARGGPDALFVNPAALAALEKDEFRVHNAKTEIETTNTFGLALRIRTAGTIGLSYRLVDYGETQTTDEFGNPTGTIRLYEQALFASFATAVAEGLNAGLTYKLYQWAVGVTSTTHGIDAGVQFHPRVWPALQLGASVVHLGQPLQVINAEQASPMPTRIRAGAAYEVMHHFSEDTTTAVWATVDVAASWREGIAPVAAAGVEAILDQLLYVRAGYTTGTGRTAGAAVGLGLRYDRFDVAVAKSFVASATSTPDPFQVTFAISF